MTYPARPIPTALYDAVILGAGPAGLFCAREAARRGLSIALVDHQAGPGRKLSMAGGGMGNITNRVLDPRHYVGENPGVCRAALKNFDTADALALLQELGFPWEERDFGQIFGLQPAAHFAAALVRQCRDLGVAFHLGSKPKKIRLEPGPSPTASDPFSLQLPEVRLLAPQLVIATGSTAWPASGSSDLGVRLARNWGHRVIPFQPVLVPLVMPADWPLLGLEGISLNARLTIRPANPEQPAHSDPGGIRPLLITHRGLSGPAALVASCFWSSGDSLVIDFLPESPLLSLLHDPQNGKLLVRNLLARRLPARLADRLCPAASAQRKVAELGKQDRQHLAAAIHAHTVTPQGTEGLRKAEAARGGVALEHLTRNLQSQRVPGLFFCGEVLDITGLLGGYNIHWALASAKLVGSGGLKKR